MRLSRSCSLRRILCLSVAVLLAASANATEAPSDEEQIRKLEDDWVRALERHNREGLNKIVAPGLIFIEPDGTLKNRAEYLANRSSNEAYETESFQNDQVKVKVFGNFALASGLATITERGDGKRCRFSLRWKEFWRKEAGTWQVLASQATL